MNNLKKYCHLLKCPHINSASAQCENIYNPLHNSCCHIDHICTCMPEGYQDTFYFFLWKKSVLEKIEKLK